MEQTQYVTAVLLDEAALDLDEIARACGVDVQWVQRHVQGGLLPTAAGEGAVVLDAAQWRFCSDALDRARRLVTIERDFDADEELAGLVVDLVDEVRRLRARMQVLGVR